MTGRDEVLAAIAESRTPAHIARRLLELANDPRSFTPRQRAALLCNAAHHVATFEAPASSSSSSSNPITRPAAIDYEARTVTFAVTLAWGESWMALDGCEVAGMAGRIRRAIREELTRTEFVAELVAVETFDPFNESHIGAPA